MAGINRKVIQIPPIRSLEEARLVIANSINDLQTHLLNSLPVVDYGGKRITNVGDPVGSDDVVTLKYLNRASAPIGPNNVTNINNSGGNRAVTFETNGVLNGDQTLLNLVQGTDITLTNTGGDVTIATTFGPSGEYNVAIDIEGTPAGGSVELFRFTFTETVDFQGNWSGSEGSVQTNPTGAQTWNIQKNGSNIGTVTISTGGVVGFTTTSGLTETFSAGDVLRVIGSSSVDATLSDVSVVFAGLRTVTGPVPIRVVTALWVQTLIPTSQIVGLYTFTHPITFAGNWSGSYGSCGTNPTASATFTVYKNNVSIGTVVVSTLGVFTFTTTSGLPVVFTAGDVFKVTAPSVQDVTLTNVAISFSGQSTGFLETLSLVMPSEFTVSGSPASGATPTITVAKANENANIVFAGPSSGGAAAPTFRALVAADLPLATSSVVGAVKPDNTTITISGGVISSVGSGGGSIVLITSQTASASSSLSFTSFMSASYDEYEIRLEQIFASSSGADILLQYSTDGGSTWDTTTSNYISMVGYAGQGGDAGSTGFTTSAGIVILHDINSAASYGSSGICHLILPGNGSNFKENHGRAVTRSSNGNMYSLHFGGIWKVTTAANAIKILPSAGTFTGVVRIFGVKNS